jgi:integrase/recombinase XerD
MIEQLLPGFERHLRILQGLTAASVKSYSAKATEFAAWLHDAQKKDDVALTTRQDVEAYLENCFYLGNSNDTRLTKLVALTRFFRYLCYERRIPEDPTAQVPKPRRKRMFVQKFTKAEVLRIFAAIDITREKGLRDAVIIMLGAFCGLRDSEIVRLALHDIIDEEGRSLDVHITGKFATERQVYLWKVPSDILRAWLSVRLSHNARSPDPLVVSYRRGSRVKGRRLSISMLDGVIKSYAAAAGVRKPKVTMHMLRATHASDLRHIQGYDTPAIAERLGHRSIATTDRYFPTRGRIHRTYPSLAAYWREFATIWSPKHDSDRSSPNPSPGGDPGA